MASSGLLSRGRQTDEGGCPSGLVALVSKEFQRQVDALDLAEPSFRFGSAATQAIAITRALLGWGETPLRVAIDVVTTSKARTAISDAG